MEYIGWRKYFTAIWCFIECLLFPGLIYGWAPLVFVFKKEGFYEELCDSNTNHSMGTNFSSNYFNGSATTQLYSYTFNINKSIPIDVRITSGLETETEQSCKEQDNIFALAFTIGSSVFCGSCLFMGPLNYKFGTRWTRVISMILFVSGTLILAFANKEIPWLLFVGFTSMGVGGLQVFVTNAQVSKVFKTSGSTYVGLLAGAYDSSCVIMYLVKLTFENGIERMYPFIVLTALHIIVAISTFLFLPRMFILESEEEQEVVIGNDDMSEKPLNEKEKNDHKKEIPENGDLVFDSLRKCLCSPTYVFHVIWLCLLQLRFFYYLVSLNTHLNRLTNSNSELVSYFTDVSMYTMFCGVVTSTVAGFVYDWQKRIFKDSLSTMRRRLQPAVFPMIIATILSMLQSVFTLFSDHPFLYGSFILMTVKRSFLYGVGTGYLATMYPIKYFGMLYGIMIVFAGGTSFLQMAFFSWSQAHEEAPFHVNIAMLCLVSVSLFHPLYQWWICRRHEREAQQKREIQHHTHEERICLKEADGTRLN